MQEALTLEHGLPAVLIVPCGGLSQDDHDKVGGVGLIVDLAGLVRVHGGVVLAPETDDGVLTGVVQCVL